MGVFNEFASESGTLQKACIVDLPGPSPLSDGKLGAQRNEAMGLKSQLKYQNLDLNQACAVMQSVSFRWWRQEDTSKL